MGDVPIAYIEGAGGVRVGEDEIVAVGKHDVSLSTELMIMSKLNYDMADTVVQSRKSIEDIS